MRSASFLAFLLACACETPVRPAPPDATTDAPDGGSDAPDAAPCASAAGFFVAESTCPGLDDAAFGACIAQSACTATIAVEVGSAGATFELDDELGTFTSGTLAPDVTCSEANVTATGLDVFCTDRIGAGCSIRLTRRDSDLDGLCCTSDEVCDDDAACTLVAVAAGPPVTTACVPRDGAVAEGGRCTRIAAGDDDCAAGLYCTGFGGEVTMPTCHALCRDASGCAADDVCVATGAAPAMGFCSDGCDPFTVGSCGAGRSCAPSDVYVAVGSAELGAACDAAGTAALGAPCATEGCIDGAFCVRDARLELVCAAPCDGEHPCAEGTCMPLGAGDLGACR